MEYRPGKGSQQKSDIYDLLCRRQWPSTVRRATAKCQPIQSYLWRHLLFSWRSDLYVPGAAGEVPTFGIPRFTGTCVLHVGTLPGLWLNRSRLSVDSWKFRSGCTSKPGGRSFLGFAEALGKPSREKSVGKLEPRWAAYCPKCLPS